MPSATLFSKARGWFNPALFKKNITRFWPIWGIYTVILFFALPMELINRAPDFAAADRSYAYLRSRTVELFADNCAIGVFLAAFFGLLAAMALFSYLMNSRSCQLLHSLPIRREGLFLTNWLSGLWFFAVPDAVIALLCCLVGLVCGLPVFPDVLLWFFIQTVFGMFFFCFAFFVAMFTGQILALPIFYGILNVLVTAVSALLDFTMELLLVGYPGYTLINSSFVRWCTPAYQLIHLLTEGGGEKTTLYARLYSPVGAICYCIVLGAVFTFISVVVYRFRQLERAGDLVTVGWVRPVFQYGFGVCVGLSLGLIVNQNFFYGNVYALYVLVVLFAAAGAFAGRMLLKKTLRVFREGWKGVAVMSAVVLLFLVGGRADLFGYQRWTPNPAKVVSVEMYTGSSAPWDGGHGTAILTEAEDIAAVVDFHRSLVQDLEVLRSDGEYATASYYAEDVDNPSALRYETANTTYCRIMYSMSDGTRIERRWHNIPITAEDLAAGDTYAAKLQALINRKACVQSLYLPFVYDSTASDAPSLEELEAVSGWLSNTRPGETRAPVETSQSPQSQKVDREPDYVQLSSDEASLLWQAVKTDLAAGDLGRRYLLEDRERYENCYQTDLTLTLMWTQRDTNNSLYKESSDVEFTVQASARHTLAALEELGLENLLLPHVE